MDNCTITASLRGGIEEQRGREFHPVGSLVLCICCSLYMKEDMAREMDLNQFVGSDKHLEETLLENR